MILAALIASIASTLGGYWYGHRQVAKACEAGRYRAEAQTLRATLVLRDAVAVVDRNIARKTSAKATKTETDYAKLRADYKALKKSRAALKKDPPESLVRGSTVAPDPKPRQDSPGAPIHEPICPVADDLPISDDLFGLYLDAYRPLLRADP